MKPVPPLADSPHTDMSPEAIDQRLRDLAQIYKLGMSLKGAQWLGPVEGQEPSSQGQSLFPNEEGRIQSRSQTGRFEKED